MPPPATWTADRPEVRLVVPDQADGEPAGLRDEVPVLPLLCVHDTHIPWGELYVDNVPVLTPARLLALVRSLPAHMDEVGVMLLAEHARHQVRPAT
jgi:hypothetical protein